MTSSGELCGPAHSFRIESCCVALLTRRCTEFLVPLHSHLPQRNENVVVVSSQTLNRYKQTNTAVIITLNMLSVYTTGKG